MQRKKKGVEASDETRRGVKKDTKEEEGKKRDKREGMEGLRKRCKGGRQE